ncbi:DUF2388 domain-containing protein [Pseudomonas sp. LS1212]|uniref:DUF2388 domain-containing protein n=1 Tax=Pseudomonas sp. LS1212 TaxID=2972478 RepID=UPI00215C03FF|nr:DUF2388 domain-containing protein [Pseudomonas sp. LS1212]UVJ42178.1 DUF2388 domain-containing protein [Pseudomonas sp. LS1212]
MMQIAGSLFLRLPFLFTHQPSKIYWKQIMSTKFKVQFLIFLLSLVPLHKAFAEEGTIWPVVVFFGLTYTTFSPFISTLDNSYDNISKASLKEDAATFVASDGAIRGPFLESALQAARREQHVVRYDDMSLTQAILASK